MNEEETQQEHPSRQRERERERQQFEGRPRQRREGRPAKQPDPRPYISEVGRKPQGIIDKATFTGGMVLLALVVGFVIGFLVFLVLNLSTWLTGLIWGGYLDGSFGVGFFPLIICTIGGLAIGAWTHFADSRVEPLEKVMAEFKETGNYDLGGPGKAVVSFLLPLVFGGSIGFEAGLTGLITAACCWIRDRLKMAGLREAAIADVTIAASLSAIFGAPFAGIVAGAESSPDVDDEELAAPGVDDVNMRRSAKLVLYTAAAFGAFGGIAVFSSLFGASAGFPRFDEIGATGTGFLWAIVALAGGYVLTLVYFGSQFLFRNVVSDFLGDAIVGTIAKPVVAGVIMGACAMAFPYVLFPGETQCHELMGTWSSWTALALVATGVIKAFVTPMCLNMGWVGGNFCPSIFAGAALGYGLAMLTGADPVLMVTVTVTAFLSGVLRSPLLAIAVLLLCFPFDGIIWMGLAGIIGGALPVPSFLLAEKEPPELPPMD